MRSAIGSLILVLLLNGALSQEECYSKCAGKFFAEKGLSACRNGCRLAMIFTFASSGESSVVNSECRSGCAKSYSTDSGSVDNCSFGCDSQPSAIRGSVEVRISNSDPTFGVARNAMNGMAERMMNSFALPPIDRSSEASLDSYEQMDPFAAMHQRMQQEMVRFQQIAQHLLSMHKENVAVGRPSGHSLQALQGPLVGNENNDGSAIIQVAPASFSRVRLFGLQGENPTPEESSWLGHLVVRARRLSVLSQWLICAALVLCFVLMLSICLAILKQIKVQRYHNLRSAHVVMPATFGEPLPAKKVPLESPSAAMDYPLIHDSPPPAYDQLSIHKEKPDEKPQQ